MDIAEIRFDIARRTALACAAGAAANVVSYPPVVWSDRQRQTRSATNLLATKPTKLALTRFNNVLFPENPARQPKPTPYARCR